MSGRPFLLLLSLLCIAASLAEHDSSRRRELLNINVDAKNLIPGVPLTSSATNSRVDVRGRGASFSAAREVRPSIDTDLNDFEASLIIAEGSAFATGKRPETLVAIVSDDDVEDGLETFVITDATAFLDRPLTSGGQASIVQAELETGPIAVIVKEEVEEEEAGEEIVVDDATAAEIPTPNEDVAPIDMEEGGEEEVVVEEEEEDEEKGELEAFLVTAVSQAAVAAAMTNVNKPTTVEIEATTFADVDPFKNAAEVEQSTDVEFIGVNPRSIQADVQRTAGTIIIADQEGNVVLETETDD